MDPERWKHIERVYERAASCSPEQRDAFLDELCNDDGEGYRCMRPSGCARSTTSTRRFFR